MSRKFTGIIAGILAISAMNIGHAQNGPIEAPDEKPAEESTEEPADGSALSALESLFGPSNVEPDYEEIAKHALGKEGNPVRCEMPSGERAYLERLRCTNGKRPQHHRAGSTGVGPYGNVLDLYEVKCGGAKATSIYMDMYHPGYVEALAVNGFTIVEAD